MPRFRNPAPQVAEPTQPPPIRSASNANPAGLNGVTNLPSGAYQPERIGFRYSSIFRSTGPIYNSPIQVPPVEPTFRASPSIRGGINLNLPSLYSGIPLLQQGFEPTDADLKIGPVFWKFRALTGAVLASDNINLTHDHRESGTISIISLSSSLIAQITEGLRLAVSGSFVFFPNKGKFGISGFASNDIYNLGLSGSPYLRSQILWDTNIGGWNVVLADDFEVGLGSFSNDFRNDFALFEGFNFDEEDRAGRYIFRPPDDPGDYNDSRARDYRENRADIMVFSNTVSALTERLLPTQTRLRVRIFRQDLWYNQGGRGLPSLREGAQVLLASERENLRFKPYLTYEATRSDIQDKFDHEIRIGIAGPITDQLHFRGEFGHYWSAYGDDGTLWTAILHHTAGPYTTEELFCTRSLSSFNEEVRESIGYRISQVFGPKLTGDAFIIRSKIEDLRGDNPDRTELRTGVRLLLTAGPKTSVSLSGIYGRSDSDIERIETWTGRLEIGYNFTDTLLARLAYQYRQYDSNIIEASYYENLVVLSLTKYFH